MMWTYAWIGLIAEQNEPALASVMSRPQGSPTAQVDGSHILIIHGCSRVMEMHRLLKAHRIGLFALRPHCEPLS